MQVDRWNRTQRLFLQTADLPPDEQARLLDSACEGDSALRAEVESLLASDRKNGSGVAAAIESAAALLFSEKETPPGAGSGDLPGRRLGAYRVEREIGRGGMGAVYLATRDDDQYRKRVAIKVVKRGMDTAEVLERFRHERQILANLDHPFIARLLDGGTTYDGRPFFVMDYVEGVPVDVFCHERGLSIKSRLHLFLDICEAVSHAHRNLVVHRDLKPGNIFVTADGSPRLLDFGVAKLLGADEARGAAMATMAGRAFTPEYASPEQVRGLPVATAADVYSLGAILYELLTGERAQPIETTAPLEIERVVCDAPTKRPSLRAPQVDADLDYIVLMAMRKEPERRYPSVDALADDIRRYLNAQPVVAREGSFRYRARKLLRRQRAPIAAGVVFVAVLITGATTSAIQAQHAAKARASAEEQRRIALANQKNAEEAAREAERQRANAEDERRQADLARSVAEAARRDAELRFAQVRELAGKFLLDFHDAIAPLPGSTPARKMVVETGLQYYDTLVREASGNRALLEEIARGYDRLGDVQGNSYNANLGDTSGALASYRKAEAIRARITDESPEFLRDRMGGTTRIGEVLSLKGDLQQAGRLLRQAIEAGEQSPAAGSRPVREALARAYSDLAAIQFRTGSFNQALEPAAKMLALWTEMAQERRDSAAENTGLALGHARLGDALLRLARYEEAMPHIRQAIAIDRELVASDPHSVPRLHKLYVDYSLLSLVLRRRPELATPGEDRANAETTADLADRIQVADPNNNMAYFDVMSAQTVLGDWLRDHGDAEASIPHYQKAVDAAEHFAASHSRELLAEETLMFAHQRLAAGLGNAGRLEQALEHCRKAEEAAARADKSNPGLLGTASTRGDIAGTRADAYAHRGQWQEAVAGYSAAAAIFEDLVRRDAANASHGEELTAIRIKLAGGYAALAQWPQAVQTMQTALDALDAAASHRALTSEETERRKTGQASLDEWKRRAGQ